MTRKAGVVVPGCTSRIVTRRITRIGCGNPASGRGLAVRSPAFLPLQVGGKIGRPFPVGSRRTPSRLSGSFGSFSSLSFVLCFARQGGAFPSAPLHSFGRSRRVYKVPGRDAVLPVLVFIHTANSRPGRSVTGIPREILSLPSRPFRPSCPFRIGKSNVRLIEQGRPLR